ncbi:hypothetical protein BCR43DRAFT_496965 [Syncephalastrum racemosum]|uniref:Uncharacterized protein n=1 Tax=Syncephalastrum racemosum TaxID=13706 RepID=A0A1X2H4X8_SYNRA|nr:hypothetical protein BCR43DRAFT_496965 [Syncephalastrum racemosum]
MRKGSSRLVSSAGRTLQKIHTLTPAKEKCHANILFVQVTLLQKYTQIGCLCIGCTDKRCRGPPCFPFRI